MTSTYTTSNLIEKPDLNDYPNAWHTSVNSNMDDIDDSLDGWVTKSATATLTAAEAINRGLISTGGNVTLTVPALVKWYIARNSGTGLMQVKTSAGTAAYIPPGLTRKIYCDGTDCFQRDGQAPWALLATAATTSGTSKSFSGNTYNLGHYSEIAVEFLGISHAGAGSADFRFSLSNSASPSTFLTLGTFAAGDVVHGSAHLFCGQFGNSSASGPAGIMIVGVDDALATPRMGANVGQVVPFFLSASNMSGMYLYFDFNGETLDAGSWNLYGR